jgi:acyl-coenzyme A synthetase/AMP-(fatty) acid ligase
VLRANFAASNMLAAELQTFFKQHGAPHMYPRIVEFTDALPRTPTGKIKRAGLRRG